MLNTNYVLRKKKNPQHSPPINLFWSFQCHSWLTPHSEMWHVSLRCSTTICYHHNVTTISFLKPLK